MMANPSIITIDDDHDQHDDVDDVSFGVFKADIVGIRYYKGKVNTNEMVSLVREPHNPYDANAIKVNNVFGVQVGHIKREQAKVLARIVDKSKARLEGVVPFGVQNKFSMPCYLSLLGKEADKGSVNSDMKRGGYPLRESIERPNGVYESSGPSLAVSMKVSQQAMKKEMDNLFMNLTESCKTSSREAAEAIKTSLLPHQKQALAWMMSCENDDSLPPFWVQRGPQDFFNSATNFSAPKKPKSIKGGILADDMGLGKTLEIIALIVTNFKNGQNLVTIDKSKPLMLKSEVPKKKRRQQSNVKTEEYMEISDDNDDDKCNLPELPSFDAKEDPEFKISDEKLTEELQTNGKSKYPKRATKRPVKYTVDEDDDIIDDDEDLKTAKNKTKKSRTEEVIQCADVVEINDSQIPVEDTIEVQSTAALISEAIPSKKRTSKTPRRKSKASNLEVIEGEVVETFKSKRTKGSGARATLIVCPLSVLSNWQDQLASHVWPGLLQVYTYYGSDRIQECDVLAQKDIVLTTYQTLSSDFNKKNSASPLSTTKWLRVVLDEGHCIRNANAQQSKATHALNAERRWIVTGTPIQNSMKDLWSLICFLKIEPFIDRQWWTRVMERPIKQGERDAVVRLQQLMKCIAIRRTKDQQVDGKPLIVLPAKNLFINYIELSAEERDVYQALADKGKTIIGKYMKAGTLLSNYGEVLVILTRLRQLCCHPKLCTAALEAAAKEAAASSTPEELRKKLTAMISMVLSSGVDEECSICLDSLNRPVITHCAHIYCRKCIENVIGLDGEYGSRCPLCRGQIALDKLVEPPADQEEENSDDNQWNSSAKVDALMLALEKQRQNDPTAKCLVVSQFTKFLKILKQPLEGRGFNFVSLDGTMTQVQRAIAIRIFNDMKPGSPTVFLLSLKAGGVGLNLTAATKVYLMDPAWNPAAEDQCYDRCHRLGQTKDVDIYKFVVKNSIEERMLDMQDKKRKLMSGAFGKQTAENRRQQRINDVNVLIN